MRNQHSEETKHLDLDKKQGLHIVNHVKFDVTKEKLEMTTENSIHKPLCSVTNSNYNSNTPIQDKIHLEDSIGGCFRSSSQIANNKPDVVNFTCILTSPDDDNQAEFQKPAAEDVPLKRCEEDQTESTSRDYDHVNSYDKDLYYSSLRTESKERLCDYVQLFDETCNSMSRNPSNVVDESGALRSTDRHTDYDEEDSGWKGSGAPNRVASRSWYGSTTEGQGEKQVLVERYQGDEDQCSETGDWNRNSDIAHNGSNGKNGSNKNGRAASTPNKRYGPLGNASGILKHVNLHGRNYVPVLPPLPAHHFAQARDSPDEGYEDEVEEEMDM